MALTDDEFEMIEAYLDDEMLRDDRDMFEKRIAHDSQIRAAVQETRRDRGARAALWVACEPSDAQVSTLLAGVRSAVKKEQVRETLTGNRELPAALVNDSDARWLTPYRVLRYVTASAACLAIGFFVGQSRSTPSGPIGPVTPATIVFPGNQVAGSVVDSTGGKKYQVQLIDSTGNVVGVQSFDSLSDAKEFSDDIRRLRQQPQQPARGSDTVLIKGEF